MDLSLAQQVLAAAMDRAEAVGVRLSIAVVDARGHDVLSARMDGAAWFTPHIARTKARTCVALDMDSADVAQLDAAHPGLVTVVQEQVGHTITTLGGGVVVRQGDTVLGAVAASGAHPDQDADAARAGAQTWLSHV